ncbi:Transcriptional regulator calD [Cladobotryum mycophilum]|uniref:Transcriptional regulator calD n=1 Tax=Cladobotryum mycophilum TaxID=491253 RepID=A0ABR0SUR7_9HYPO
MAPHKVSTDRVVPLLPYDTNLLLRPCMIRALLVFEAVLDPKLLHDKLWHIVAEREGWSRFGARLRKSSLTGLEYHIPARFSVGRPAINFNHITYRMKIREHPEACQLLPTLGPITKSYTAPGESFYVPKWAPKKISDYFECDLPLLGVNVISFQDATLIAVHLPHTITDGTGVSALLRAWTLALQNREDEIAAPLAIDVDPLDTLDEQIRSEPRKGWLPEWQSSLLSWTWTALGLLPRAWDPPIEFRTVVVPAREMRKLREMALQHLAAEQQQQQRRRRQPPVLSDGDILSAWWSQICVSHLPKNSWKRAALIHAVSFGPQLPSVNPACADRPVLSNMVEPFAMPVEIDYINNKPLGQVASKIRAELKAARTFERLKAYAAWSRRTKFDLPPPFLSADMFILSLSNLAMAKSFELDFSAAAVNPEGASHPLNPSNFLVRVPGGDVFNATWIMGKDGSGNYWLNCGAREDHWPKIDKILERGIGMTSDPNIRARL